LPLPFEQWAQTLSPAAMHLHCLPDDIRLYRLYKLPVWVSDRRMPLEKKLAELSSTSRPQR